jgi:dipeptidyl aminopeptidase/acylaminoacyl peptidase
MNNSKIGSVIIGVGLLALASCSSSDPLPTAEILPTVDLDATVQARVEETAVAKQALETVVAVAVDSTIEARPTATTAPTAALEPSPTSVPTATVTPTATTPPPTIIPTSTPVPTATLTPNQSGLIAFSSERFYDGNFGDFNIYVMNPDGSDQHIVESRRGLDAGVSWSRTGSHLAFHSQRNNIGDPTSELFRVNIDGTNLAAIGGNVDFWAERPSYCPCANELTYDSNILDFEAFGDVGKYWRNDRGDFEIYHASETALNRLTDNADFSDIMSSWEHSGARIVFSSNRDGDYEIYVMSRTGTEQTRLTMEGGEDYDPSWSPDGTKIAFSSNRDGDFDIYVMNVDGSNQTRLTDNEFADRNPSWSPDSTRLVFDTNRDGNLEIYAMDVDGSSQTRLTDNTFDDFDPAWSH